MKKRRFNTKKAKTLFQHKSVQIWKNLSYNKISNTSFTTILWLNSFVVFEQIIKFWKAAILMNLKKKSFNYYIYCYYQEACYKKWDARFPDFLFLKESFRKQLKLYRPPGLWCSETELIEYANFLCGIKRIISSLMKKVYFFWARNK